MDSLEERILLWLYCTVVAMKGNRMAFIVREKI